MYVHTHTQYSFISKFLSYISNIILVFHILCFITRIVQNSSSINNAENNDDCLALYISMLHCISYVPLLTL